MGGSGHRGSTDTIPSKGDILLNEKDMFSYRRLCGIAIIWGQNFAMDPLESIVNLSNLAEDELCRKWMNMNRFESQMQ